MASGPRHAAYVVLFAIGATGVASVTLHALLGPGRLPCCTLPPPIEWAIPILGGIVIGLPAAVVLARSEGARVCGPQPGGMCVSCGHEVGSGWRLCPECGYIFDEDGSRDPEGEGPAAG